MNPGPILTIRNTFPTHLHTLLFLVPFYSENRKAYLLSCTHKQIPKTPFHIIFTLLHCYLLYCICYHILFYLYLHLVLDNHSVELGTQDEEIVLQVAWRRMSVAFLTAPREFDIKPEFPRGKNLLLLQHSALGVPMSWHLFLVSSHMEEEVAAFEREGERAQIAASATETLHRPDASVRWRCP
jgi:hypothetical protein